MASALRPLIAGNWKMNGLQQSATELAAIIEGAGPLATRMDLLVCPPAPLIAGFAVRARNSPVAIGGQDCHAQASGAFTGDISAARWPPRPRSGQATPSPSKRSPSMPPTILSG